jgi:hypothetical protein
VEPIAGVSKHFKTVVISYRWTKLHGTKLPSPPLPLHSTSTPPCSAEGSISNSKSQEDFPYFFRTIAENKQYK